MADAAEDTAEAIDKTTDSAEGLQGAVSQVGQQARTTGNDVAQAGDKGRRLSTRWGAAPGETQSSLVALRGRMMATFNVVNELESFYNRGKAIGQWILDSWDKVIEGAWTRPPSSGRGSSRTVWLPRPPSASRPIPMR